jgi:hypothetical protein
MECEVPWLMKEDVVKLFSAEFRFVFVFAPTSDLHAAQGHYKQVNPQMF